MIFYWSRLEGNIFDTIYSTRFRLEEASATARFSLTATRTPHG